MQRHIGSRVGVAAIFLAFIVLDTVLRGRYRIAPLWFAYVLAAVTIAAMLARSLAPLNEAVRRVERVVLIAASAIALALNVTNLVDLSLEIVFHAGQLQAAPLLAASVGIWVTNCLTFTLIYWLIDRGGPDARIGASPDYPDFDFPAMSEPEKVVPNWQPTIVDYLFIGFTTNTAFSPTEAMPLTARAKALMIAQSVVSLLTIVIVAARAIGIIQ